MDGRGETHTDFNQAASEKHKRDQNGTGAEGLLPDRILLLLACLSNSSADPYFKVLRGHLATTQQL